LGSAGSTDDGSRSWPTAPIGGLAARPALEFVEVPSGSRGGVAVLARERTAPEVMASPAVGSANVETPAGETSTVRTPLFGAPLAPLTTGWTLWGDTFL
jgi:hypothetical protein